MKASVYNWEKKEVGTIELADAIFAREWNADLVHQVVTATQANARSPWAHAKGRGEVRGGGIKPWRQKGTGRARHGSIRSPLWKGGGASHGPVKARDFTQKINKKMQRAALYSALSRKLKDGEIVLVDSMQMKDLKTKMVAANLKSLFTSKQIPSTLIVPSAGSRTIVRAARNIARVQTSPAASLNIVDVMKAKHVVIEKDAVTEIK